MIFHVEVPLYNIGIIFVFGYDRQEAERWLSEKGWLGEDAVDADMMDSMFKDPHDGITVSRDSGHRICVHVNSHTNHRSIAHEIYHATMKLMEWVGMYPSPANEEAFAYVVGFITEEVYIKIQEHGSE